MRHYRPAFVWASIALSVIVFAVNLLGQRTNPSSSSNASAAVCVRLLSGPAISVDPMTGSGETTLVVRNQLNARVELALTAGLPTSTPFAIVEFSSDEHPKRAPVYEGSLEAKKTAFIRMAVRNVWEDSEFDIDIANHYGVEKVGKVHVKRSPISVKLDGVDRLKLNLLDGRTTRLYIRNDDSISYSISWKLVNGEEVCSSGSAIAELPPKSVSVLGCTPTTHFRLGALVNLLKADQSHDGYRLLLSTGSSNSSASDPVPTLKTFSGEAALDYYTPLSRGFVTYVVVIALLCAGGVSSLLLSYSLPNKLQRLDLKDKLVQLAARTADLSTRIDSRLAVLVRLERSRLSNLLNSRSVLSPDFAAIAAECKTSIARLASKVTILEQMDLILGRVAKRLACGVAPTQVDEINISLQEANVILAKSEVTDAEIQAASNAAEAASTQVDKLGQANDEFGRKLATAIHELIQDIDHTVASSPAYQKFVSAVPGPGSLLRSVGPDIQIIDPDHYVELDTAVQKMTIIRDYVLLLDGTSNVPMRSRIEERTDRLISYLQTQSWEGLRYARLLLREMKDDVYPERLLQLLTVPTEASIEMDPPVAYERSPLEFAVRFRKPVFDNAAAREELSVEWDFGDDLTNKGWVVSHYFQFRKKQDTYDVRARIYYSSGDTSTDIQHDPITLDSRSVKVIRSEIGGRVGERTRAEALKLFAALLIAVFGLISGAQDQISKLDVLPGLVAVFLVGFSADSIKRLLTTESAK